MYVAQPIEWTDRGVVMLDQRRLPAEEVSYTYTTYQEVAKPSAKWSSAALPPSESLPPWGSLSA